MESVTGEEVVKYALQDLGVIRPGETPSTGVMTDCMARLNQFLASLSIEQLLSQSYLHTAYALQAGISRYTFGVGGVFGTAARPQKAVAWKATSGAFQNGGLVVTFQELQQASKDGLGMTSAIPGVVGADVSSPLINVGVFPVPSVAPGQIELTYWNAVTPFIAGAAAASWPDGWARLLHFGLAIDLLPRYGRQGLNPTVLAADFQNAKNAVADLNRPQGQPAQAPGQASAT